MRLLFVADGPRDRATIPEIVGQILSTSPDVTFREWKRLRLARGSGYKRKLRFALLLARDEELDGVVATIDSDNSKPRNRLVMLQTGRDEDRQTSGIYPIPTALGEAVPHVEAWLLDDPKAVKDVLQFPSDKSIPNVLDVDPKTFLDELIEESRRIDGTMELLSKIARSISVDRCNHSSDTGLREFVEDVREELKRLVPIS